MNIGMLEQKLLQCFPAEDAESWDFTGLMVGDPAAPVTGVAVALDQTVDAVRKAAAAGASVLITHHPTFIDAPKRIMPASAGLCGPGAVVWEAVKQGVALMDFHTALDVSVAAQQLLASKLDLQPVGLLQPLPGKDQKGYGHQCAPMKQITLADLARTCKEALGGNPRVWGNMAQPVRSVVIGSGSAGHLGQDCLAAGIDCLVCGELKYHSCLDLAQAGLCVIELGHDVSELPFTELLQAAACQAGVPAEFVTIIDQSHNWTCV